MFAANGLACEVFSPTPARMLSESKQGFSLCLNLILHCSNHPGFVVNLIPRWGGNTAHSTLPSLMAAKRAFLKCVS